MSTSAEARAFIKIAALSDAGRDEEQNVDETEPVVSSPPDPPADPLSARKKKIADILANAGSFDAGLVNSIYAINDEQVQLENAEKDKNSAKVKEFLERAEAAVKALEDRNAALKQKFDDAWKAEQPGIDRLADAIIKDKYGNPPGFHFVDALGLFQNKLPDVASAKARGHWKSAAEETGKLQLAMKEVDKSRHEFAAYAEKKLAAYQTISTAIDAGKYPGGDDEKGKFKRRSDAVEGALKRSKEHEEYGAAYQAIQQCDTELSNLRKSALDRVLDPGVNDSASHASRERVMAMINQDPDFLKSAKPYQLDALVNSVGSKAGNSAERKLVQAAITAKYGPELTGKLGGRYLCRLYACLGKVPAAHTKQNPKLQTINRTRKIFRPSDYSDGAINLNLRTKKVYDKLGDAYAKRSGDTYGFDQVTLHEVGHSVDDQQGFMNGKAGVKAFGGWKRHTIEDIADIVGGVSFYSSYKDKTGLPFLQSYLVAVLGKKNPNKELENHHGAKNALWKQLADHEATATCKAIRLKGSDSGLWESSDAAKYAIGGRVYQQSYEDRWTSYDLEARGTKISNYQFRADGEWYAEAYAAFFMGKLPGNHPLHSELQKDVGSSPAPRKIVTRG